MLTAKVEPVSIARAVVNRADGRREVYYSYDVPWWQFRRQLKLRRHLRMMKREDRKA